jgi:hypothetical protein
MSEGAEDLRASKLLDPLRVDDDSELKALTQAETDRCGLPTILLTPADRGAAKLTGKVRR